MKTPEQLYPALAEVVSNSASSRTVDGKRHIFLNGMIASYNPWNDPRLLTPEDFRRELDQAEGMDLVIELDSPGGDAAAGTAMANMLDAYEGKSTVLVLSRAWSAATFIMLAADEAYMGRRGTPSLLFHYASTTVIFLIQGTIDVLRSEYKELGEDIEKQISELGKINDDILESLVAKTGKGRRFIENLLEENRRMYSDEALELNLIDGLHQEEKDSVSNVEEPETIENAEADASAYYYHHLMTS